MLRFILVAEVRTFCYMLRFILVAVLEPWLQIETQRRCCPLTLCLFTTSLSQIFHLKSVSFPLLGERAEREVLCLYLPQQHIREA